MISSFHNVNDNFYKELFGQDLSNPKILISTYRNVVLEVPAVFARKSAEDFTEASKESYPKFSVQNYMPELNPVYFFDKAEKRYAPDFDGTFDEGFLYTDSFPLIFRYDVGFACKKESEMDAAKLLFFQKYLSTIDKHFKFNKESYVTGEVYDPVGYQLKATDVYRTDGVLEVNFEFKLFPFVHLEIPVPAQTLQVNVSLITKQLAANFNTDS